MPQIPPSMPKSHRCAPSPPAPCPKSIPMPQIPPLRAQNPTPPSVYLLHVPVEAEDVEDAVAVHLGLIQAVDHEDGAVGVGAVLRGGRGRRRVPVLGAVPAGSPAVPPHRRAHPSPFVVGRRGAVALVVVVPVVSAVRASCEGRGLETPLVPRAPPSRWCSPSPSRTVLRRVVSQERGLPLALVGGAARVSCGWKERSGWSQRGEGGGPPVPDARAWRPPPPGGRLWGSPSSQPGPPRLLPAGTESPGRSEGGHTDPGVLHTPHPTTPSPKTPSPSFPPPPRDQPRPPPKLPRREVRRGERPTPCPRPPGRC